ncbi:FG-GAP repeat domain-containing protein [Aurantivibrio plasticivorans]
MSNVAWHRQLLTILFGIICFSATADQLVSDVVLSEPLTGQGAKYRVFPFEFAHSAERVISVDFNVDGHQDLLVGHRGGIALYFNSGNSKKPFDTQKPNLTLGADARSLGWAVMERHIYAVRDNAEIVRWSWQEGLSEIVLDPSVDSVLPLGTFALNFVRDINADGYADLIIPQADELHVRLGLNRDQWEAPFVIRSQADVDVRVRARNNLNVMVGQSVIIPQLNTRDVNADGRSDLIVISEQRLSIYLASRQNRFGSRESFGLDLTEVRDRLGNIDFDKVDYNNLSSLLSYGFSFLLVDIDGDKIDDLLLREGGRVVVFSGNAEGINLEKPRQVLKSAGNVLGIMLRDEDGDGRLDLWLSRVQDISVGNIFMWLAISGSVDVEVFVYKNSGQQFARRPHRKLTVSYAFPSLFRSADLVVSAFANQEQGSDRDKQTPSAGEGLITRSEESTSSIVQLVGNELWIHSDVQDALQGQFLGISDYSPKRDHYDVDLKTILENPTSGRTDFKLLVAGKEPSARYAIETTLLINDIAPLDLNGDKSQDFMLVASRNESELTGLLWLSVENDKH